MIKINIWLKRQLEREDTEEPYFDPTHAERVSSDVAADRAYNQV